MANKVVNLTIKLKDGVSGVLNRIRGGIASTALGFKKLASVGATAFRGLAKVAVGAFAGMTVAALSVGKAIKTAFGFETLRTQLKVLLGSMAEATKQFNILKEFSAKTPFQLPGIIDAYQQLLTFTEGALATKEGLELVGDAAAARGKDFSEVAYWVGRLYSALKNGDPFLDSVSALQRMGIAGGNIRGELTKLTESGAKFGDMWAVVENQMLRFRGGMAELSRTGDGLISTLKDNWTIAVATFGDAFMDAAKGGITQMIETLQRLVNDGTITKWANQAKEAFDNIVAVGKIIAGGGPEGSRGELIKAAGALIKAAFVVGAEYFKSVVWPIMKGGGELLGTELGKFVKNLASWGWDFTKDLASTLIQAAPVIGAQIGKAFLDATKKVSDNMIARGEAGRRAREELGPRPQQISGGLFRPPQNQAEIKKYYDDLDALTEKYYNENIALQKKKADEQIQAVADAFVSSAGPTTSIEKPAEIIEKSAEGVSGELTDLEKALADFDNAMSDLSGFIDGFKETTPPSMSDLLAQMGANTGKELKQSILNMFDDMPGIWPKLKGKESFQRDAEGRLIGGSALQGGGGPNMMGAATLGAKMLGQQSPFRALGKQGGGGSGIDFGVKARVPELTNRQQFEMRKQQEAADKAAREAARSGDPEAAAKALGGVKSQEVPQKLDMIFEETKKQTSIMEERMGGVQGGG